MKVGARNRLTLAGSTGMGSRRGRTQPGLILGPDPLDNDIDNSTSSLSTASILLLGRTLRTDIPSIFPTMAKSPGRVAISQSQ